MDSTVFRGALDAEGRGGGVASEGDGHTVRSLTRGLRILRCFNVDTPQLSPSTISRQTGLPRPTVHRLLRTLEAEGFLIGDQSRGEYILGSALMPIAHLSLSSSQLIGAANLHLRKLVSEVGEAVDLAVWTDRGPMLMCVVQPPRPFQWTKSAGHTFQGNANVHSKIFLAYSEAKRREALRRPQLALTPHTITDPAILAEELTRVAATGIAYDIEENGLGICSAGAPVFGVDGEVKATMAIVAPVERWTPPELVRRHSESLLRAARALSRDLGYEG